MIEQNKAEFDILGITRWHELGYKGKGIKVTNLESIYPAYFLKDSLGKTFDYVMVSTPNVHGQKTLDCINQVMPEAILYPLSTGTTRLMEDTIPFILSNGIHLVSISLGGTNNDVKDTLFKQCIDKGVILTTSAGNKGMDGLTGYALNPLFISVGAVHYRDSFKDITRATYSSVGKELDFTSFSNLWLRDAKVIGQLLQTQQGTSFSNPIFSGMLGLVQQFFIEITGRGLYKDEIELFIMDNLIDLGSVGFDEYYGHGLFVLPEPSSIDVNKYLLRDKQVIIEEPTIEIPIVEIPVKEVEEVKFKDTGTHWAKGAIEFITDIGIMSGYPDETFQPDRALTRAEYAFMKAKELGYIEVKK